MTIHQTSTGPFVEPSVVGRRARVLAFRRCSPRGCWRFMQQPRARAFSDLREVNSSSRGLALDSLGQLVRSGVVPIITAPGLSLFPWRTR